MLYDITYMWNLKYDTNELMYETEQTHRRRKQTCGCGGGGEGEGWSGSLGLEGANYWASLVVQWLRVCLPVQGTRVRALVWEDPTCRRATRPVSHNY